MNETLRREPFLKGVNQPLIRILCMTALKADGVFIEFGVFTGLSFRNIYNAGNIGNRPVHAVDSFQGMPKSNDGRENLRFPPGGFKLEAGAVTLRFAYPDAIIHEGLIPGILDEIDIDSIAFAHIDLDHYVPTLAALRWTWQRLSEFGIVCIHDYYHHDNMSASRAVKEWAAENDLAYIGLCDTSIFYWKGVS